MNDNETTRQPLATSSHKERLQVGRDQYVVCDDDDDTVRRFDTTTARWLRIVLRDGSLGPIAGTMHRHVTHEDDNEEDEDDDICLDLEGFGGPFASELARAQPLDQLLEKQGRPASQKRLATSLAAQGEEPKGQSNPSITPKVAAAATPAVATTTSSMIKPVPDSVCEALATAGVAVWKGAVEAETCARLRIHAQQLHTRQHHHGQDPKVRTDEVLFLRHDDNDNHEEEEGGLDKDDEPAYDASDSSESDHNNTEADANAQILRQEEEEAKDCLVQKGLHFLTQCAAQVQPRLAEIPRLLRPPLGMLSCYRGKQAFYTWHLDNALETQTNHDNDDNDKMWSNFRVLTAILYLNENWTSAVGGELEFEPLHSGMDSAAEETPRRTVCVAPEQGTVVLFDSRRIRHRVRPTHCPRYALTQWFVTSALVGQPGEPRGPLSRAPPQSTRSKRKNKRTKPIHTTTTREAEDKKPKHEVHTGALKDATTTAQDSTETGFSFGFF